ncbi:3'-5' exonuclease [Nocardiopsis xinjiangensis]|uniref:3'-5' exonuclease n=1 Tax=Nocardiopsis xinjiangensis TaxID=124285 RepID=UPI00034B876A|nr:3'-5' exonuclease [Nocardiopsis xinjiangensis]
MLDRPWTEAPLCALDLEGTGAQDKGNEVILEVAVIPIVDGSPDMQAAYESLVNPGRPVPRRPWISPGLTDEALREAPSPAQVGPELEARVNGRYMVGHNVIVDWKLVHLRHPHVQPAGLIDTLRLTRHLQIPAPRGLGALLDRFELREQVDKSAPSGRPHRALWDTVAAAVLLARLLEDDPNVHTLAELLATASVPGVPASEDPTLF